MWHLNQDRVAHACSTATAAFLGAEAIWKRMSPSDDSLTATSGSDRSSLAGEWHTVPDDVLGPVLVDFFRA